MTEASSVAEDHSATLELRSMRKSFGATLALRDVDLTLRAGEVHALLGQNGSGKSTLIKMLAGYYRPDGEPTASVQGTPFALGHADSARDAGLRFVHQDLAVIPDLDVTDNLALGGRYVGRRWLADGRERRAAQELLDRLGIAIDSRSLMRDLGPAEQTMVAVARALRGDPEAVRVLVLDEVTAALPEDQVEIVFALVRRIRDMSGTVLFVTHRLEEVPQVADRVTVLRDGARVTTIDIAGVGHEELVELVVGRPLEQFYPEPPTPREDVLMTARGLRGDTVRDVSFDLHRGEIVGVAGLDGSGREELPYLLFGASPITNGELAVGATVHRRLSPAKAIAAGLALVPADRAKQGSTPEFSLRENLTLPRIPMGRWRRLSRRTEQREVSGWLERLNVVPPDPEAALATLSGGNQQKVVLARWLRCDPDVLVLDEPTQGVDVGAKAAIYDLIAERTRNGTAAVLIASTDYEELAAISDRVLVLHGGRVTAEIHRDQLSSEAISARVLGVASP
jgi:ribose transport system ATP-binding protein